MATSSSKNRMECDDDSEALLVLTEREKKRQKMLDSGFTEAEIMAMEFSQEHGLYQNRLTNADIRGEDGKKEKKKKKKKSKNKSSEVIDLEKDVDETEGKKKKKKKKHHHHHKHHKEESVSTGGLLREDPEDDDESRPPDPFNPLNQAYDVEKYKEVEQKHKRRRTRGRRWEHDWYRQRSPSPIRERTEGPMWDTRAGSWRSRAGGVCLAPTEEDQEEEPARYKIPLRVQFREREIEKWEQEQEEWGDQPDWSAAAPPSDPPEEPEDLPRPRRGSPVYALDEPL
ncbi:hypothetical protein FOL47_001408 [Perkinsus chesapeaki]|uniref:Uncharacterized protein n=1 Tax=Perkinsus chesapeaki TaxID=330153 RepID=A0A7J6MJ66_PERCH|nr:hypothetical protein FOL47_001408 [Perkinsus chesapeaki]